MDVFALRNQLIHDYATTSKALSTSVIRNILGYTALTRKMDTTVKQIEEHEKSPGLVSCAMPEEGDALERLQGLIEGLK